jgi:hypothetical protein
MWAQVLTVLNTLLILTTIGLGVFGYQNYILATDQQATEAKAIVQKLEELEEFKTAIERNPLLDTAINANDTLVSENGELKGFTNLTGFLITEEVEEDEVVLFAYSESTDNSLEKFIDEIIQNNDDSIFDKDQTYYYLPLGCVKTTTVEGQSTTKEYDLNLPTETIAKLEAATEAEQISVRAFFSGTKASENVCDSLVTNMQIAEAVESEEAAEKEAASS